MNRKELIERIRELDTYGSSLIERNEVLELIRQLDEPQKVKVSEEEAKFLKTFDFNCESDVTTALYHVSRTGWGYYLTDNDGIELKDLTEGFRDIENRKRLIRAILFGYEVEKEKRYLVKVKGVEDCSSYLKRNTETNKLYFGEKFSNAIAKDLKIYHIYHTRKELEEANFGWVFDCEGVEIEEVTE